MSNDFFTAIIIGLLILLILWIIVLLFIFFRKPPKSKLTGKLVIKSFFLFLISFLILAFISLVDSI